MIRTDEVIELGKLALAFGRVNRATFHEDGITPESDTDHTVMLGIIACHLCPENLNRGLVAEYVLVHDLVEALVGDTNTAFITPEARAEKEQKEAQALEQLLEKYGGTWLGDRLVDYEEQKVREARYVRFLDKAMPKITHILNGAVAIKSMGKTRQDVHEAHQAQLKRLKQRYWEFDHGPLQVMMRELMMRTEIEMSVEVGA